MIHDQSFLLDVVMITTVSLTRLPYSYIISGLLTNTSVPSHQTALFIDISRADSDRFCLFQHENCMYYDVGNGRILRQL